MKKILLFLIMLFPLAGNAQRQKYQHRVSVQASYSNDIYDYSGGYHYLFCDYVGLGGNFGAWSIPPSSGIWGESEDFKDRQKQFYLEPSLLFRSPNIFTIMQCGFHIECEPSFRLSSRDKREVLFGDDTTYHEYKTNCFSWRCDFSFGINFRNLNLLASYALSNLDVDRDYKSNGSNDGFSKKVIHHVGFKLAFQF